jgi:hypothetical protein
MAIGKGASDLRRSSEEQGTLLVDEDSGSSRGSRGCVRREGYGREAGESRGCASSGRLRFVRGR